MGRYSLNHTKFLLDEERAHLEAVLARHADERDAIMLETALYTGGRAKEILDIRPSDLNLYDRTVHLRGIKGSNDRTLPLPDSLFSRLDTLAKACSEPRIFNISYARMRQIWLLYRPCKKGFHSLRHTFAIAVFKRTRDLQLLKIALGHQNIQNTMIYAAYVYSTEEMRNILPPDPPRAPDRIEPPAPSRKQARR